MLIKRPAAIPPSEITPRDRYLNRREFMRASVALGASAGLTTAGIWLPALRPCRHQAAGRTQERAVYDR